MIRIFVAIVICLWCIARYRWNIKIDRKNVNQKTTSSTSMWPSPHQLVGVDGTLFRWPKKSYSPRTNLIQSSSGYLHIWIYDITFRNLRDLLVNTAHRIPVKLIIEHNKYKDNGVKIQQTIDYLRTWGIQIKSDDDLDVNFTHAKTFVSAEFALIQTSNLTKNSFDNNREYYFVTNDKNIISNLQYLFDRDWKWQKIDINSIHPSILVCPLDCRSKLHNMIKNAKYSIKIQNQQINDEKLIGLLNDKIIQWIKVQIIVADKEWAQSLTPQFPLGTIRRLKKPYPHAKMMMIDDRMLKISSINFTSNSIDNNREIWIITDSTQAVNDFKHNFEEDRKTSQR